MATKMLDLDFWAAAQAGKVSGADLARWVMRYAEKTCPGCLESVGGPKSQREVPSNPYIPSIRRSLGLAQIHEQHLELLEGKARQELKQLLELGHSERRVAIRQQPARFGNPMLVDLLLEESQKWLGQDPRKALEMSSLAEAMARRLDLAGRRSGIGLETLGRACAKKAETLRAVGDPHAAETYYMKALDSLRRAGTGDPLVQAEMLEVLASLRQFQRRLSEAQRLLDRAASRYRRLREEGHLGSVLVRRAEVLGLERRLEEAIAVSQEAEALLESLGRFDCAAAARQQQATFLCDAGCYHEARELLAANPRLPGIELARCWLEARIAEGLGASQEAEALYMATKEGYLSTGKGYDTALVSLELALLYSRRGQTAEIRRIADEMLPLFATSDLHRDAMSALLVFRDAAREEAVTAAMVRETIAVLKSSQSGLDDRLECPS